MVTKLNPSEMADYNRTLETFRKAWGYSINEALLERRALDAVLKRRQFINNKK